MRNGFFLKKRYILLGIWMMASFVNKIHAQVNLPTGTVQNSVPLYSYSDKNRLVFSASLQYISGNGIKVNEPASNVGLGWQLNIGGSISRITAGKPDDQYGNIGANRQGTGRLYANYSSPTDCYSDLGHADQEYYGIDREADIFNFNLNGRTGSFIISRMAQGETTYKIRTLNDSKLKIQFVEENMPNVITRISKFIITTEDGIQYTFSEKELTEIVTTDRNVSIEPTIIPGTPVISNPGDAPPTPEEITVKPYRTGKYVINNWYLSEIRNVLNGQRITFEYSTYDLDFSLMKLPVKVETLRSDLNTVDKVNYTILDQRFVGKMKHINKIFLPGNEQLEFLYAGSRWDIPGDSVLSTFNVRSNGVVRDSYTFNYQYFNLNGLTGYTNTYTETTKTYLRLSLQSIYKNIGTPTPYVSFDYCPGVVPPRASWFQDYFGYFTGTTLSISNVQKFFDLSLRQPNVAAQNGMLKRIKYPAGGYLEYEYEIATCMLGDNVKTPGGVRVKKTTIYDGIDHSNDQIKTYKYVNDEGPSGMGYEEPVYSGNGSVFYVASGTHLASKIIYAAVNYALAPQSGVGAMAFGYATQEMGLLKIIDDVVSLIVGNKIETGTIYTRSTSGYPLSVHNSLPLVYERVEVLQGDETKNAGKIVYDFTSFLDRPVFVSTLLPPYTFIQRLEDWSMGLPKVTSYYDAAGKLIKQVTNQYQFFSQTLNTDTTWLSCKCDPQNQVTPVTAEPAYRNKITYSSSTYYPVTGRSELIKTTTKNFYLDNNSATEETRFEYDPLYFYLKKISKDNSAKETIEQRFYYPGDYNANAYGYQQRMMNFNLLNMPVSTETWLVKQGVPAKLLNAQIAEFQEIPSADIVPVTTYEFMSNKPVEQSVVGAFDPTKLNRAPAYFKKTTGSVYDIDGNLVQKEQNGNVISYIYAYDIIDGKPVGKLVASVKNAALNDVAFTGFETSGIKGGWNYNGAQLYYTTGSGPIPITPWPPATGIYYYALSSGSMKKSGLTAGRKYKLTYWASSGPLAGSITVNLNVSNTTKEGATMNGYTFYEREFIAGSADLEITGSCYIDNVRLFPIDAQMTTYDYDNFNNATYLIDANDNVTRYIYDNKQRVIQVLNQYGNILKINEYKD